MLGLDGGFLKMFLCAFVVYLYAGWCIAEVGASKWQELKNIGTGVKNTAYLTLLIGWPVIMPWMARAMKPKGSAK